MTHVPNSGTSFLVPVSGTSFWSVCHGHYKSSALPCRLWFEVSSYNCTRDILWGFQNSNSGSRDPHMTPFDQILIFFPLVLTAVDIYAKFDVSSFNCSRDIRGSENSQSGSRDPTRPFWPIFLFFRKYSLPSIFLANLKFLASTTPKILGGQKFQKWVTWPPHDPFYFFH